MRRLHDLDAKDRHILALLETDGRRANSDIARITGLSAPTVAERIARMRDIGVIRGFTVKIDAAKIGLPVGAIIEFQPPSNMDLDAVNAVAGHPAVRSCYKVTGNSLLIMLVRLVDSAALHGLLLEFAKHGETRTALILSSELEERPIFAEAEEAAASALLRQGRA